MTLHEYGKMASGARWGLIPLKIFFPGEMENWQNGQWSPLGIDTTIPRFFNSWHSRQNGQWSPLGIDTHKASL